jgi:hypothetical protein
VIRNVRPGHDEDEDSGFRIQDSKFQIPNSRLRIQGSALNIRRAGIKTDSPEDLEEVTSADQDWFGKCMAVRAGSR